MRWGHASGTCLAYDMPRAQAPGPRPSPSPTRTLGCQAAPRTLSHTHINTPIHAHVRAVGARAIGLPLAMLCPDPPPCTTPPPCPCPCPYPPSPRIPHPHPPPSMPAPSAGCCPAGPPARPALQGPAPAWGRAAQCTTPPAPQSAHRRSTAPRRCHGGGGGRGGDGAGAGAGARWERGASRMVRRDGGRKRGWGGEQCHLALRPTTSGMATVRGGRRGGGAIRALRCALHADADAPPFFVFFPLWMLWTTIVVCFAARRGL